MHVLLSSQHFIIVDQNILLNFEHKLVWLSNVQYDYMQANGADGLLVCIDRISFGSFNHLLIGIANHYDH